MKAIFGFSASKNIKNS